MTIDREDGDATMKKSMGSSRLQRFAIVPLVIVALTAIVSCRTTSIGPPVAIDVPPRLSLGDIDVAVIAFLTAPDPEYYDSHSDTLTLVLANPIGAMLLDAYKHRRPDKRWFIESYSPGAILVGFQKGDHYMRVAIESTTSQVSLRIVSSRNLRQSQNYIHTAAKTWLQQLEIEIRDALGAASLARAGLDAQH